jgi:hypothetical protein
MGPSLCKAPKSLYSLRAHEAIGPRTAEWDQCPAEAQPASEPGTAAGTDAEADEGQAGRRLRSGPSEEDEGEAAAVDSSAAGRVSAVGCVDPEGHAEQHSQGQHGQAAAEEGEAERTSSVLRR